MTRAPDVSVVIPTAGRDLEVLRSTVESLAVQTIEPARMEACVVIDGAAPEAEPFLRALAARMPFPLEVLAQEKAGQGAARNLGIARARGRIVLMLDDDIAAEPQLVREHLALHEGRDDTVVTGALPVEAVPDAPAHHRVLRRWWSEILREMAHPWHQGDWRDFVTGNVSVPRERLVAAGGFDPMFSSYGREDYELGYRLQRGGARFVFAPRAVGLHRYRKPVLEWIRQSRAMGHADVRFARKHREIAGAVMMLSTYPIVRWRPRLVALAERAAVRWNARGGVGWKKAAAFAQASWYWKGVREETRDGEEFRWLMGARIQHRMQVAALPPRKRLYLRYLEWVMR